jgi:hypothetical protein
MPRRGRTNFVEQLKFIGQPGLGSIAATAADIANATGFTTVGKIAGVASEVAPGVVIERINRGFRQNRPGRPTGRNRGVGNKTKSNNLTGTNAVTTLQSKQGKPIMTLNGTDHLTQVTVTNQPTGTVLLDLPITATMTKRLADLAGLYQRYKINATMRVVGQASTLVAGTYCMGFVRDVQDTIPSNPGEVIGFLAAQQLYKTTNWFNSVSMTMPMWKDWLYVEQKGEPRLYSPGKFVIAVGAAPGATQQAYLDVYLDWDVELDMPTVPQTDDDTPVGPVQFQADVDLWLRYDATTGNGAVLSTVHAVSTDTTDDPNSLIYAAWVPPGTEIPEGQIFDLDRPGYYIASYHSGANSLYSFKAVRFGTYNYAPGGGVSDTSAPTFGAMPLVELADEAGHARSMQPLNMGAGTGSYVYLSNVVGPVIFKGTTFTARSANIELQQPMLTIMHAGKMKKVPYGEPKWVRKAIVEAPPPNYPTFRLDPTQTISITNNGGGGANNVNISSIGGTQIQGANMPVDLSALSGLPSTGLVTNLQYLNGATFTSLPINLAAYNGATIPATGLPINHAGWAGNALSGSATTALPIDVTDATTTTKVPVQIAQVGNTAIVSDLPVSQSGVVGVNIAQVNGTVLTTAEVPVSGGGGGGGGDVNIKSVNGQACSTTDGTLPITISVVSSSVPVDVRGVNGTTISTSNLPIDIKATGGNPFAGGIPVTASVNAPLPTITTFKDPDANAYGVQVGKITDSTDGTGVPAVMKAMLGITNVGSNAMEYTTSITSSGKTFNLACEIPVGCQGTSGGLTFGQFTDPNHYEVTCPNYTATSSLITKADTTLIDLNCDGAERDVDGGPPEYELLDAPESAPLYPSLEELSKELVGLSLDQQLQTIGRLVTSNDDNPLVQEIKRSMPQAPVTEAQQFGPFMAAMRTLFRAVQGGSLVIQPENPVTRQKEN